MKQLFGKIIGMKSKLISKEKIKVAVGLSGGVDSAVSAALLVDAGFEVTGVFLECWKAPGCRAEEDRKDALEVALKLGILFKVLDFKQEYKEKVVDYFYREYEAGRTPNPDTMCNREIKFGMFYRWAMKSGFDAVATGHYARIQRILKNPNYKLQITNKSQIINNNQINSDVSDTPILQLSESSDFSENEYVLMRGADQGKDQSYFLYQIKPEQLEHIMFPIGGMLKSQVREEAKKRGLFVANKPDSQGICFIGEVNVRKFLEERIKPKEGEIILKTKYQKPKISENSEDSENQSVRGIRESEDQKKELIRSSGNSGTSAPRYSEYAEYSEFVIGVHDGAWFYTIGQRIGVGLDKKELKRLHLAGLFPYDPAEMPPMLVVEKDVENNRVVVGFEEDIMQDWFEVGEVNWLKSRIMQQVLCNKETEVWVRIRNLGQLVRAKVKNQIPKTKIKVKNKNEIKENRVVSLLVQLDKPIKGVAEGQACVFYSGNSVDSIVIGGGIIV